MGQEQLSKANALLTISAFCDHFDREGGMVEINAVLFDIQPNGTETLTTHLSVDDEIGNLEVFVICLDWRDGTQDAFREGFLREFYSQLNAARQEEHNKAKQIIQFLDGETNGTIH